MTPAALNDGYALGMTVGAVLLVAAVLIALVVLPRTRTAPEAEQRSTPLPNAESAPERSGA